MAQEWWYPTAFQSWGDEERGAIQRVLASGRLTMGPEVAAFEREFADWHGRRHGIMVNSGSSANLVMVAALKTNGWRGRKVAAVPAVAWSTTYAPLVQHGFDLVVCDVDQAWNMARLPDPASRCDVVVACSILGSPANLDLIKKAAGGAILIEDNCESLGARTPEGRLCGTFGLMSSFSFFWSHQVSAVEGGMVLTDDDELADSCRMLRAHGWTRDVRPAGGFEQEYDFRVFGYNVRPLEMHAAVAREQLRKLDGFNGDRCGNASYFRQLARGLPVQHQDMVGAPAPFGLSFLAPSKDDRAKLVRGFRSEGIDCRLPTGGCFTRHAYGAPWREASETPMADQVHDLGLFLGNAPFPITDKIDRAVEVIRKVLR